MTTLTRAVLLFASMAMIAVRAQEAPPSGQASPAATPAPQAELKRWLDDLNDQWRAVLTKEVTVPCDLDVSKARQQYLAAVEGGIARATSAGDLEGVIAWRKERDLFPTAKDITLEGDATFLAPSSNCERTGRRKRPAGQGSRG
ncbi:MAG: hypothetical protein WDN28_15935 [Chthoniobacter sp.]